MLHRFCVQLLRLSWVGVFVALVFTPLLLSTRAGGRGGMVIELSLTAGLLAFSLLLTAAVLPSRIRSLTMAFGIERLVGSHRWLAVVTTALVLLHVVLVVAAKPSNVALLYVPTAPPRARAATAATVALVGLCLLSLHRRRMGTGYQRWRRLHVVLAVVALAGTLLHVLWLNHLLRDRAMREFFGGCTVVLAAVLLNRWVRKPLVAMRNAYVVRDVRPESPSVSTLVLAPVTPRQRVVRFSPGQFAWIRMSSRSPWKESHPFTIASGSYDPDTLEFTIKHAGDWTRSVPVARRGQRVYVDGPHGDFSVDRRPAGRLLLVAAGVGITPMMSIMRTLADRRDARSIRLVVGARTEDELLFRSEIHELAGRLNLRVLEVLSNPPPHWSGATGRVDRLTLARALRGRAGPTRVDVYICGPSAMVENTVVDLHALGVPPQRVHTEQFDMV